MRVVFMGSPEFAVPALQHIVLSGYRVAAVYTQPDKPAGRGRYTAPPPVKEAALTLGLSVIQPTSLRTLEAAQQMTDFRPDVVVVAAFGQLLPQRVLDIPRYGCLNIHPSLLPRFRGASPVAAAILAGEEFTGVTIMLLDKGMDTGPILTVAQIPISAQDNAGILTGKLSLIGARLVVETLAYWTRGEIAPRPQDDALATYCKPISKEDGKMDWSLPAVELWRRVRAFNPWPGCYTRWQGKQLKLLEVYPLAGIGVAGTIVSLSQGAGRPEAAFGVLTGDGILGVLQVQLEGKRPMSSAEFLRGQRGFIGSILA
ncbi:MAG: methionyl-tRNA formyltransferase [Chloroflexi bacterium]|nr:methionyl-tRNA formyltransferase [Chloroflexota bacterium]